MALEEVCFLHQIPQELFDRIISFVVPYVPFHNTDERSSYARVARKWQPAVEKYTFHTVSLKAEHLLNGRASQILSRGSNESDYTRLEYVREIYFTLLINELPLPLEMKNKIADICATASSSGETFARQWDDDCGLSRGCHDSSPTNPSDDFFTQTVRSLLSILKQLPTRREPYVFLSMAIKPGTGKFSTNEQRDFQAHEFDEIAMGGLRCKPLELNLCQGDSLPIAPMVENFEAPLDSRSVFVKPSNLCTIASSFSRLRSIRLEAGDLVAPKDAYDHPHGSFQWTDTDTAMRRRRRNDFAAALTSLPDTVDDFCFSFAHDSFRRSASISSLGGDKLSSALFEFCKRDNVRMGEIDAAIDFASFGSGADTWSPSLEELSIFARDSDLPSSIEATRLAASAARPMPTNASISLTFCWPEITKQWHSLYRNGKLLLHAWNLTEGDMDAVNREIQSAWRVHKKK